jgi:CheY-like chemotaxis protein
VSQRRTVLICDDEAALRELVRIALDGDYRFAEASDGAEALTLARELRPDLVVLDVMLPVVSGAAVLERVRADAAFGRPVVIVLSAWSHERENLLAAGADRFLTKPFDPDELRKLAGELLAA